MPSPVLKTKAIFQCKDYSYVSFKLNYVHIVVPSSPTKFLYVTFCLLQVKFFVYISVNIVNSGDSSRESERGLINDMD